MVEVDRKMMEEEKTKRYRRLAYLTINNKDVSKRRLLLTPINPSRSGRKNTARDKKGFKGVLSSLFGHLRTKNARPAVRTLMPATMTGQRCGSMVEPDCWKIVVMKKTMVEMPVHWARM